MRWRKFLSKLFVISQNLVGKKDYAKILGNLGAILVYISFGMPETQKFKEEAFKLFLKVNIKGFLSRQVIIYFNYFIKEFEKNKVKIYVTHVLVVNSETEKFLKTARNLPDLRRDELLKCIVRVMNAGIISKYAESSYAESRLFWELFKVYGLPLDSYKKYLAP